MYSNCKMVHTPDPAFSGDSYKKTNLNKYSNCGIDIHQSRMRSQVMGWIFKPIQFSPMALFMLVFFSLKFWNFFLVDLDENENDLLRANGTGVHAPNDSKKLSSPKLLQIARLNRSESGSARNWKWSFINAGSLEVNLVFKLKISQPEFAYLSSMFCFIHEFLIEGPILCKG